MQLGAGSLAQLATCDPELQRLVREASKTYDRDFSVNCGHRGEKAQNDAVARGASKTPWPLSKHNSYPALAVDLWVYPLDGDGDGRPDWGTKPVEKERWEHLRAHMLTTAKRLGIKIRTISWDLPHFELTARP